MLFYTGLYGSVEQSLLLWFLIIITLQFSCHVFACMGTSDILLGIILGWTYTMGSYKYSLKMLL